MKYGEPRYTKDLDVWAHNSPQNSVRLVGALKKFGAPLEHDGITSETFTEKQVVYQIGIAPVRIDILTEITGVQFPDAWRKRDRKSTRLNSSHVAISYAVFCLKKKKKK